jgi:hypothetical protein
MSTIFRTNGGCDVGEASRHGRPGNHPAASAIWSARGSVASGRSPSSQKATIPGTLDRPRFLAIRPRSASLEAAGLGPGGPSATAGRRSNVAPARPLNLGGLGGRKSKCRPGRSALLRVRRLLGARRAARTLSRLGRAGAGLAAGHRGLVAGHRRLRGTLPGLHRSFLNGAFGNRRRTCRLSLRSNRKFSLAMPPTALLQSACLARGRRRTAPAFP